VPFGIDHRQGADLVLVEELDHALEGRARLAAR
jgi:hypothetical protein